MPDAWDNTIPNAESYHRHIEESDLEETMQSTRAGTSTPRESGQSAARSSIQLVVNLNRCQAYAQCCFLAPDVFRLHGEEALWYDPSPDPGQWEQVQRAAAACPVQAITVEMRTPTSHRHGKPSRSESWKHREKPHAAQRA
jgi:ferredoxin